MKLKLSQRNRFKLLELNSEEQLKQQLTLIGSSETENAVLVTATETFQLKQQSISNTMLIMASQPSPTIVIKDPEDANMDHSDNHGDDEEPVECCPVESAVYILERVKPDFSAVRLPLFDVDANSSEVGSAVTVESLCLQCQSSRREVLQFMRFVDAMVFDGGVYRVGGEVIADFLTRLMLDVRGYIGGSTFDAVDLKLLLPELDQEFVDRPYLFMFVVDMFSVDKANVDEVRDYGRFKTVKDLEFANGGISFDLDKMSLFLAARILLTNSDKALTELDFMQRWQTMMDELLGEEVYAVGKNTLPFYTETSNLQIIVTDGGRVDLELADRLPPVPQDRLKYLFNKRTQWPVTYIKHHMAATSMLPDQALLKFTKSFADRSSKRICTISPSLAFTK